MLAIRSVLKDFKLVLGHSTERVLTETSLDKQLEQLS